MFLAAHGPDFSHPVIFWVKNSLLLVVLVVELVAFIHCRTRLAEALPVVGWIRKGGWLGLTGGSFFFTLLLVSFPIFGLVAIAAALIYLLDVRPALRDAVDGHGSW